MRYVFLFFARQIVPVGVSGGGRLPHLAQRNPEGIEQALGVALHAARKPTRAEARGRRHPLQEFFLELVPGLFASAHEERQARVVPQQRQQKRHRRERLNGVEIVVAAAALVVAPPLHQNRRGRG